MTDPIIKTIIVPCVPARAFEIFVDQISNWWPLDQHAASAAAGKSALAATIEPRVGGAFYETMHDGGRDDWGVVEVYDPPNSFATTWHPGNNKNNPTRVDVSFKATEGGTQVILTHSGWEVWADAPEDMRNTYDGGWDFVFGQQYAVACRG